MRDPKTVMKKAVLCAGMVFSCPIISFCQDAQPADNTTVIRGGFGASATIPETEYNTPARAEGNDTAQADNGTVELEGAD